MNLIYLELLFLKDTKKELIKDLIKINKKILFKYILFSEIVIIQKEFNKNKIEGFITASISLCGK